MTRSFTIYKVKSNHHKLKSKKISGGRFESSEPSSAAKKAGSSICRQKNLKEAQFSITLKETTQGSSHKLFTYKFSRVYNPVTVKKSGKLITFEYETNVSAIKSKSRDGAKKNKKNKNIMHLLNLVEDDEPPEDKEKKLERERRERLERERKEKHRLRK